MKCPIFRTFHLFEMSFIFHTKNRKIITILWDIDECRRIRSLNERANCSVDNLSDPLHWLKWLLFIRETSLLPLIPWLLLLWMLLIILLAQALTPPFGFWRISISYMMCVWFVQHGFLFFIRTPRKQYKSGLCVK